MRFTMYGCGRNAAESAKRMAEAGISGVCLWYDEEKIAGILSAGLSVTVAGGGFYIGSGDCDPDILASDCEGKKHRWFDSSCPSHEGVRAENLAYYQKAASVHGVKGVIVDGARYPSLSSADDASCFFTCFCPRCREKMEAAGYDPDECQRAARLMRRVLMGEHISLSKRDVSGASEWFRWRQENISEHLKAVQRTVKAVNPALEFGAFFFSPCMAEPVGQSYRAAAEYADYIAPMIYTHYPVYPGTACLNHELGVLAKYIEDGSGTGEMNRVLSALTGQEMHFASARDVTAGVPRSLVQTETERAFADFGKSPKGIRPILELNNEKLEESVLFAKEGGAEEVSFFAYEEEAFRKAGPILRKYAD